MIPCGNVHPNGGGCGGSFLGAQIAPRWVTFCALSSTRSPRWDNQTPCLVPHTGNRASVVRGLVSTRRGSEELGMIARSCGPASLHMPPIRVLVARARSESSKGATAMKAWKASAATNEPRNACPSFRLDPQWSGYGPMLPQGPSRKPETGPDLAKPPRQASPRVPALQRMEQLPPRARVVLRAILTR